MVGNPRFCDGKFQRVLIAPAVFAPIDVTIKVLTSDCIPTLLGNSSSAAEGANKSMSFPRQSPGSKSVIPEFLNRSGVFFGPFSQNCSGHSPGQQSRAVVVKCRPLHWEEVSFIRAALQLSLVVPETWGKAKSTQSSLHPMPSPSPSPLPN